MSEQMDQLYVRSWYRTGKRKVDLEREVIIEIGKVYRIEPLNPRAKKNRGRTVMVLGFVKPIDEKSDILVKVKYLDTNRPGRISSPGDLVELAAPVPGAGQA